MWTTVKHCTFDSKLRVLEWNGGGETCGERTGCVLYSGYRWCSVVAVVEDNHVC